MTNLLDTKISACREAMQKVMVRAERIMELHKRLNEKDELQNDHCMLETSFFTERDDEMGKDSWEDR